MPLQNAMNTLHVMKLRLRRRRTPALVAGGSVLALTVLIACLLPAQYESRLKILVKNERVNAMVSQDQQTQGIVYVDEVGESRVNTEIELLTSADLLRRVAEQTRLATREQKRNVPTPRRGELAELRLRANLVVEPIRKSSVISIRYRADNAPQAAAVLRALMSEYLDAHVRLHGSPGAVDAFQSLAARYTDELQKAQDEYEATRRRMHVGSLVDDRALAEQKLGDLEKRWTETSVEVVRTSKERDRLHTMLEEQPLMVQREKRVLPNQAASQQLTTLLAKLENKRTEVKSRYLPDDRVMQDISAQIEQTRQALRDANINSAEESTTEANPIRRSVEGDLFHAETENVGAVSQQEELSQELAAQRERVASLDAASPRLQEMSRKINQLAEIRDSYSKKAYEAQVGELLDHQRIANVAILEAPFEPTRPASPHRALILVLGVIWSGLIGLIVAVLADLLSPRLTSPFELQRILGVPVLGTLAPGIFPPRFGSAISEVYDSVQQAGPDIWSLT